MRPDTSRGKRTRPRSLPAGPTLLLALLLVVALAGWGTAMPAPVSAHAEPEEADPPIEGIVPAGPERLHVWFGQELFRRAGENALEVRNAAGDRVDLDDLLIDDLDRAHASVGLPPDLPPGTYTVTWRTLSAVDGDHADGAFTFTIDPSVGRAPATSASEPSPTPATPAPLPAEAAAAPPPADTPTPAPAAAARAREDAGFPLWVVIAGAGIVLAGAAGVWALRAEVME